MPKINTLNFLFCLSSLITFAGCPDLDFNIEFDLFAHPLVTPEAAEYPDELTGTYLSNEKSVFTDEVEDRRSVSYVHVGRAGGGFPDGFLRMVYVDVPKNSTDAIETSSEIVFVKKIGSHYLVHIPVPKDDSDTEPKRWEPELYRGYLLAALRHTESGMELKLLNSDLIDQLAEDGRLTVKEDGKKSGLRIITSSPSDIEALFDEQGAKMFGLEADVFKRLKQ